VYSKTENNHPHVKVDSLNLTTDIDYNRRKKKKIITNMRAINLMKKKSKRKKAENLCLYKMIMGDNLRVFHNYQQ
jgi:hypothetical protein